MLKLVVLSGAGVSAESGIATFRDAGGLWEGHDVMAVASPEGWYNNPELVLDFYNQRRKAAAGAQPNIAHKVLAELEDDFEVTVITQNVDDLHERAGSTNVVHLHGRLSEVRSTADDNLIYDVGDQPIGLGDKCDKGSQLRPNIVWFGEMVPMIEVASKISERADIFIVVGTSLAVYPAASLIDYVPYRSPVYVVDPNMPYVRDRHNLKLVQEKATVGLLQIAQELRATYH
ncbi:SIR2 family NAD-dependent protein deacylase [Fulvivirga lutimaris]|uniref:SIR2 family NAD-dependent protein deacylase n=1 Tax=Fulvivirga lutimaris TaxID=1819566 RepID=UPI0012BC10B7|nr:NAD-dependent deacylase [Fulvivirga lutimaris]MTI40687.1 NAD-dependent deacylase [Fulvivirga lutimaris]